MLDYYPETRQDLSKFHGIRPWETISWWWWLELSDPLIADPQSSIVGRINLDAQLKEKQQQTEIERRRLQEAAADVQETLSAYEAFQRMKARTIKPAPQ